MAAAISIALLLANLLATSLSLEIHFYRNSCPRAELIVSQVVRRHFQRDLSVPAGLLRLYFHDCFVRGCDASVLLDSTDDNIAEKEAPPNLTLRTFDVIDDIKAELEKECRGLVSCADILALATRDGVALSGGAAYALPTGRRDGIISRMEDVRLPSPTFSVQEAVDAFKSINLDLWDLTTLLGAHSVGFCHCGFFIDRLYNYRGTASADPQIEPSLLETLKQKCPPHVAELANITKDPTVSMNQVASTPYTLDNSFYLGVLNKKAILKLDQDLAFTDLTSRLSARYANDPNFFSSQFSESLIKLGNVGVLTGQQGEIRLSCRKVNGDTSTS
ncbi:peroxidase 57-like [Phoenix dactylifera]|uniref:Peroxidase n=1 Tax=Phoenix dactylifera TaxID=42345 RepID=A0A8B8JAN5_PHODC|nr:peroxidase 57-like [Phoenix dactylifera]